MARYLIIAASSAIGQSLIDILKKQGDEVLSTTRNSDKLTPDFILDASANLCVNIDSSYDERSAQNSAIGHINDNPYWY
jgi:NADPH:quinone reductase-like Zn-dependent oxidoreductase